MSFEATGLPLPQEVLPICSSYLTPPESRYIAAHQPADQTAAALFAQFREAYNSQAMWDYLAPSYGTVAGPHSKAGVTAYYERLNERILSHLDIEVPQAEKPLGMPAGDPFVANARLQGLMIRCLIEKCNERMGMPFAGRIFRRVFNFLDRAAVSTVLHATFSPVAAMPRPGGWEEVHAEGFYGITFPWHRCHALKECSSTEQSQSHIATTIYTHHLMVERNFNEGFFHACQMHNAVAFFLQHGGRLNLHTLKKTISILLDGETTHLKPKSSDPSVIENLLDLIQLHMNGRMHLNEQEQLSFFSLLSEVIQRGSCQVVCKIVMILRNEFILRRIKVPDSRGPFAGKTFDDHYLLNQAQRIENEAVILMAQELIRKLKGMPSERPTAEGAGAAAAAAGK